MKKIIAIYILGIAVLLLCCSAGCSKSSSSMSLRDAFVDNEEIRELFSEVASASINLIDVTKMYDITKTYYHYDNGLFRGQQKEFLVDEETVEAINKIREAIPKVTICMRPISNSNYVFEGRLCVFFSVVKKSTGCFSDYYQEDLVYSLYELPAQWYERIGEGWYFRRGRMP